MTNYLSESTPGKLTPVQELGAEIMGRIADKAEERQKEIETWPVCEKCGEHYKDGSCGFCREKYQSALREKMQAEENEERIKQHDIGRLGGLKAYNQFTLEKYTNKEALKLCAEYPDKNLFLWGAAGTGKTHLATALVRDYPEAQVIKPQHIYRACRGIKSGEEEQAAINSYIKISNLVIDDLGVDKKTDFSFQTLYEVIEGRDMAEKKGLIITSNLNLDNLSARLDDGRISSRIVGMCKIIEITGDDWRLKNDYLKILKRMIVAG